MKRIIGGVVAAGIAIVGGAGILDDDTTRDESGEIVEAGALGAMAMQVGDCIQLPEEDLVQSVQAVPCVEPHDAQVYALFDMAEGAFPGVAAVDTAAEEGCMSRFAGFVGMSYEESTLYANWFTPTQESWEEIDDREIACVIVPGPETEQLIGDLQNANV
jgi:hypothetical protein